MKTLFLILYSLSVPTDAFITAPLTIGRREIGHWRQRMIPITESPSLIAVTPTTSSNRLPALHSLSMSSNDNDESDDQEQVPESTSAEHDDADSKMEKKIAGRKERVVMGNRIASAGYFVWFLTVLIKSYQSTNYNVLSAISSLDPGPLLASGFAYILVGACQNDRLSSDTYKRLNLSLFVYSLLGLVNQSRGDFLWNGICAVTLVNSIKGYGYGLKGWTLRDKTNADAVKDISDGIVANVKSLLKLLNERSAGYLLATIFVGALGIDAFKRGLSSISCYSSLLLLATTTFTLKDAADRDRLQGTTFIDLTLLAAIVFAQISAFLSSRPKAPWTAISGAISVFSALVGASSLWKKKQEANS